MEKPGYSLPFSLLRVASPIEGHLFQGFDCFWIGPQQLHLWPGGLCILGSRKTAHTLTLTHGSSFSLLEISPCFNFPCLASQLFHYLYNQFLKFILFCLKCLVIYFPNWLLIQLVKTEVSIMEVHLTVTHIFTVHNVNTVYCFYPKCEN